MKSDGVPIHKTVEDVCEADSRDRGECRDVSRVQQTSERAEQECGREGSTEAAVHPNEWTGTRGNTCSTKHLLAAEQWESFYPPGGEGGLQQRSPRNTSSPRIVRLVGWYSSLAGN